MIVKTLLSYSSYSVTGRLREMAIKNDDIRKALLSHENQNYCVII